MRGGADAAPAQRTVRVWDLPVRLFHWTLIPLLMAMWWTGEERDIATHSRLGVVLVGLLLFRLLWGLVGSETARFARFLKGPRAVLAYLRGQAPHRLGHNPLGGWSVAVILLLLVAQAGCGLFAHDVDGMESGPLSHLVSYDTADLARVWHHRIFNAILAMAALHILAICWYLVARGEDLLLPMVTGRKAVPETVAAPRPGRPLMLVLALGLAAGLAWWIGAGAPLPDVGAA